MMTEVMTSPNSISKMRTKELANKLKHGSPKFQHVLRERCRERIREKRGQLFNRRRLHLENDFQKEVKQIIRAEYNLLSKLEELMTDEDFDELSNIDEAIFLENRLEDEEEYWIMSECEKLLLEEEQLLLNDIENESDTDVFCPLCLRSVLHQEVNCIRCKMCSFVFPVKCNLLTLKRNINEAVGRHSTNCTSTPSFVVVEENDYNLYLTCHDCFEFAFII